MILVLNLLLTLGKSYAASQFCFQQCLTAVAAATCTFNACIDVIQLKCRISELACWIAFPYFWVAD
jgi:hypothetical protein